MDIKTVVDVDRWEVLVEERRYRSDIARRKVYYVSHEAQHFMPAQVIWQGGPWEMCGLEGRSSFAINTLTFLKDAAHDGRSVGSDEL